MGGLHRPYDKCTTTDNGVINVLRSKYAEIKVSDAGDVATYPHVDEQLTSSPVYCVEGEVATKAVGLSGSAGPSGVNGTHLKKWLLR